MTDDWICVSGTEALLRVYIQPGARKTEVAGRHGDAIKIRVAAPAIEGKANAALIDYIASQSGTARSAVELIYGASSRRKRLRIVGVTLVGVQSLRALAEDQLRPSYTTCPSTSV